MLKNAAVVAGAAATMLAMAPVANAAAGGGASQDNDGINVLNDSNISVVPIQLCGNNIIGPIVPIASQQKVECTQATIEKGKH